MGIFNVTNARARFSNLLDRVAAGEDIVITRSGRPVARLVPYESVSARRTFGSDRGRFRVPEDFNEPLPPFVLDPSRREAVGRLKQLRFSAPAGRTSLDELRALRSKPE